MILSWQNDTDYIAIGKIKIFPEFNLADVRPASIRLILEVSFWFLWKVKQWI